MHKWLSAPPAPEDPPPRRTPRPHQARARHVGHPRARDDSQNRGGWGRSCSPASGTGSRKGPSPDGRLAGTGQRGCPLRSWRGGAPGARGKEGFCASPGGQGTLERRRCCSPAPESRVLGVGTLSVPPRPKHSGASPESLFLIKIQSCSISQVGAIDGLKGTQHGGCSAAIRAQVPSVVSVTQQAETVSGRRGVLRRPWLAEGLELRRRPPSSGALRVILGRPPCQAPCPRTPGKDATLEIPVGLPSRLAASRPPSLFAGNSRLHKALGIETHILRNSQASSGPNDCRWSTWEPGEGPPGVK